MKLGITDEEESKLIEDAFFILFQGNPMLHKVRVIIDGGLLKTTMKKEKFINIIQSLCGSDMSIRCELAASDYGDWYLLDRVKNYLKELNPTDDIEKLMMKDVHKDVLEAQEQEKHKDGYKDTAIQEYNQLLENDAKKMRSNPFATVGRALGRIDYRYKKR
jgi:hypothetical protein